MSSKKYADIFRKTSACFFIFCTNFTALSIMFFSEPFQEVFNGTYTFSKSSVTKRKKTVEGTHEINKKYFIDKLLLPAMCL